MGEDQMAAVSAPETKSAKPADGFFQRHPIVKSTIEVFTGLGLLSIIATLLTNYITLKIQHQNVALQTRNAAIAAVIDISDLTDARRERGAMVMSSIRRLAPATEMDTRKMAYDDAYVTWNIKVPGDELLIRANLGLLYGSVFQSYIDGLTDASKIANDQLPNLPNAASVPGLLAIMDSCITDAYDEYRLASYKDDSAAKKTIQACDYYEMYDQLIGCFSTVSTVLYDAVGKNETADEENANDGVIKKECTPATTSLAWARAGLKN